MVRGEEVRLTPKQYGEYAEESGQAAHREILRMIQSDWYRDLSDEDKGERISEEFQRQRGRWRNQTRFEMLRRNEGVPAQTAVNQ